MRYDIIRFGLTYCAQHVDCVGILSEVIAEAQRRRFRTAGGATSYVTRRLRQEGLSVRTLHDVRVRRVRFRSGRRIAR